MSDKPLLSARVKIQRAHDHLDRFHGALTAFSARNPYPVETEASPVLGIKIDRLHLKEPIPSDFSAFIGDIAHNLMSALDSLAVSLVARGSAITLTEDVLRWISFPICREPEFKDATIAKFFRHVGPEAEKIIRNLEPYKGGKADDLFQLRRLNIIDKHRAIVPVAMDMRDASFIVSLRVGQPLPPIPGTYRPKFPLKNGDELARRTFRERAYYGHAHFSLAIVFGEGDVFEGKPVLKTLVDLTYLVESTIDEFARSLFIHADSGW